jgi:hypothetical protein
MKEGLGIPPVTNGVQGEQLPAYILFSRSSLNLLPDPTFDC